jgi:hypothetical protein
MTAIRILVVGLASGAMLAGCGGNGDQKVDEGGFTAAQRSAAQTALVILSNTAVATTAVQNTGVIGYPTTCSVHLQARKPLTFKLFLSWKDLTRPSYAWLQAVIGPEGLKRDYSFSAGTETNAAAVKSHAGNALSKPFQPCEITNIGTFSIIPFSHANRSHAGKPVQG